MIGRTIASPGADDVAVPGLHPASFAHKQMPDPTHWPNESLARLNFFDRYKTQAERALRRALLNLQAVRKDIFDEHLWSQKLAIQQTSQASSAPIQLDPALNCHVIAQRAPAH